MLHRARSKKHSFVSWFVLFPLCLLVSAVVVLNATSTILKERHPAAALRLNPLNTEARINLISPQLQAPSASGSRVVQTIEEGIRLAPADARFYSLTGVFHQHAGRTEVAQRLFESALQRLPTEIQALLNRLIHSVRSGELVSASRYVELIGRRWPVYWSDVSPLLPVLLSDERAFQAMRERFGRDEKLRRLLIRDLASNASTLPLAHRILLRWHEGGVDDLEGHINNVTSQLIRHQRYAQAFLLFRLTRPAAVESDTGYVHNGDFRLEPSGNPFGWRLRRQAGATVDIAAVAPGMTGDGGPQKRRLVVRFLDTPIRFRNITQHMRLVPGDYTLRLSYATKNLIAPKPLLLAVRCIDSREPIAELTLESGSTPETVQSVDFTVPPKACPLQKIIVLNERLPLSWRYRYSGRLHINEISVLREKDSP